jgi:hypothetical protein
MMIDKSTEIMMKRLLRSYVYNGFVVGGLNCSTSGELNDDKSSRSPFSASDFLDGKSMFMKSLTTLMNKVEHRLETLLTK